MTEEPTSPTVRVRLDLAYDGTHFHGWAAQPGLRTVQGQIEAALETLMRSPTALTVAGRTDAGVHARHQVAHMDMLEDAWRALAPRNAPATNETVGAALVRRLNGMLARTYAQTMVERGLTVPRGTADVRIHAASVVSADFDARFAATGRHYIYRLADGTVDPTRRYDCLWVEGGLDLDAMNEAAGHLLGEHDFLAYCRPREGATTIRTLRELSLTRTSSGLVECRVEADAFCHSMVRSLVGALLMVGTGRRNAHWPRELLEAKSREHAAPIAPAHGLTLEAVDYPDESRWAERSAQSRRRRDDCCL
nr:tRNA pseudouridine(38-40) synthase TruA [Schaalia vaccimaxillae]